MEAQGSLMSLFTAEGPVRDWLLPLLMLLLIWGGLHVLKLVVIVRLKRLSAKTDNDIDDMVTDMLDGVSRFFYFAVSLYVAGLMAPLPDFAGKMIRVVFLASAAYEAVKALTRLLEYGVCKYFDCTADKDGDGVPDDDAAHQRAVATAATSLGKIILYVMAGLVVMANLGVDVTSLIAGVGIGGIAIALAVQNILSDLFSSFSIYADKPFEVGDFIIIGADMGTVEHIGLKSTRLRTLQGEQLVVSNKELTAVRIQNFRRMEKRRIVMTIGVTYGTKEAQLNRIPDIIRGAIESEEDAELDRCHLKEFGPSSLDYEVVMFANTPDYAVYMDMRQRINLRIYQAFEKEGIEFAYPTQTIHLAK